MHGESKGRRKVSIKQQTVHVDSRKDPGSETAEDTARAKMLPWGQWGQGHGPAGNLGSSHQLSAFFLRLHWG